MDPLGLWGWDGDWIQMGVGGLLGFYGKDVAYAGLQGAGRGAVNSAVGAGRTVKEMGAVIADTANASVEITTGKQLYSGNLSGSLDALEGGQVSVGEYYRDTVANVATFGIAGQQQAVIDYAYGNISEDEFSERVGGTGLIQLGSVALAKAGAAPESSGPKQTLSGSAKTAGEAGTGNGLTVGQLRKAGLKDAHHTIQDAAVRELPGYESNAAPGVQLKGPVNQPGTPHNLTRPVQQQRGGGTYGAERRIGYKALRKAGLSKAEARAEIARADKHFESIGVDKETPTRVPSDRR